MCMECCLGELCESCGLCVFCQEEMRSVGGGHCEVCDACLYDVYGDISEDNNCPVHGEDHCYACYEEFQCEQCGDCYAGEEDSLCQFCGLCPECCEQNSMDAGCASGEICVEDPDFEFHFCPNCEQCFCEVDYCDTCGEWCQECCDEERCSICDLCPNTYYGDLCDTCGAGGESLDEHEQYHMCEESRCGACGFCQTSLEDAFGYIECPCCGACPNECSCADDCEDCQCHQISCYASPYYTRDQIILSVTVLDGNEGAPIEDATVYFSHDKMSWHRLGETNAYGVAQGNVARVLKGDPASYNTSGWYVSVTNRKSSAAGLVLVGDVYYRPSSAPGSSSRWAWACWCRPQSETPLHAPRPASPSCRGTARTPRCPWADTAHGRARRPPSPFPGKSRRARKSSRPAAVRQTCAASFRRAPRYRTSRAHTAHSA